MARVNSYSTASRPIRTIAIVGAGFSGTAALASGFDEHLPKPVDVPVLVMTIRGLAREFVREQQTVA